MPRPIRAVLNTGIVHSSDTDSPYPALGSPRLGNVLLILITGLCAFAVMASAPRMIELPYGQVGLFNRV
jgi:hypothetical protein